MGTTTREGNPKRLTTALAAACAHPIRTRALAILGERVASPAEVARELNLDVSNVGYHFNALSDAELIEEVRQRQVRGAVEHFYRARELPFLSDEQETHLSDADKRTFAETVLSLYVGNAASAIDAGTLIARSEHHLTRLAADMDETGWADASAAYWQLFERIDEITKESAERLGESGEDPIRTVSYLSLFEAPKTAKT
jgi:DNA-binding transcriptional ArsR family regulator